MFERKRTDPQHQWSVHELPQRWLRLERLAQPTKRRRIAFEIRATSTRLSVRTTTAEETLIAAFRSLYSASWLSLKPSKWPKTAHFGERREPVRRAAVGPAR